MSLLNGLWQYRELTYKSPRTRCGTRSGSTCLAQAGQMLWSLTLFQLSLHFRNLERLEGSSPPTLTGTPRGLFCERDPPPGGLSSETLPRTVGAVASRARRLSPPRVPRSPSADAERSRMRMRKACFPARLRSPAGARQAQTVRKGRAGRIPVPAGPPTSRKAGWPAVRRPPSRRLCERWAGPPARRALWDYHPGSQSGAGADPAPTAQTHAHVVQQWEWKSLRRVRLFANPWTTQSMGFSRPEHWSEKLIPSAVDLPDPGIEPRSPALQAVSLPAEPQGKPKIIWQRWDSNPRPLELLLLSRFSSVRLCATP